MSADALPQGAAARFFRPAGIAAIACVCAFLVSLWLHQASALHDTDAYFHLAIARLYAEQGLVDELPALRLSLMRDGYGDKEVLFHLLLAPLLKVLAPLPAGRLALALFAGLIAFLLALLASRALGRWAWLYPLWLFYASTELSWRLVRLRPELLSLSLLLLAAWLMAGRRDLALGLVAMAYTLGYTAFHAFLGLVFFCFVAFGLLEAGLAWRRWPWRMLLYSWLGAGLGLILHPHFPKNLLIWWVQNVVFFGHKAELDVGTEIKPNTTDVVLMVHLGLFATLLVLLWAARRRAELDGEAAAEERCFDRRLFASVAIFAAAFGLLYALMSRFSLYFWPFATLTILLGLKLAGREIGGSLRLGSRRWPLAGGLALALLVSAPEAWRQLGNYRQRTSLGPNEARLRDREVMAAALPAGAKVAADWGPTATYLLWAPQALYLNALDPNFMAVPFPAEHAALRLILGGEDVDVPGRTVARLDSDYLAFPLVGHEPLVARLGGDPRAVLLHRGSQMLYQFRPASELITDWRLAPGSLPPPVGPAQAIADWPAYPLAEEPRARALEGYVDGDRVAPEIACLTLVRDLETPSPRDFEIEWAVAGHATLWRDGALLFEAGDQGARLGEGIRFPLHAEPGRTRFTVRLCKEGPGKGFYWREKPRG